jgi:hypothetical protein
VQFSLILVVVEEAPLGYALFIQSSFYQRVFCYLSDTFKRIEVTKRGEKIFFLFLPES